jgi:anti-sigma regulatory factor (Ser/Thr protein kinase)
MADDTASADKPIVSSEPTDLREHPDLKLTIPARAENVAVVRHAVGGLGEVLGLDEQMLSDVKLALTEACTNSVVHAYSDGEGPLEIEAYVQERELVFVVRDEGHGIVPRTDSPGLGLGLPLIATLTESLELGKNGEDHTEVRMTFALVKTTKDDAERS